MKRRAALALMAVTAAARAVAQTPAPAQAPAPAPTHEPFGPVRPPPAAPKLALRDADGKPFELHQRLQGRITALQLMFTTCSATCPIQGALFGALAPLVQAQREMQLLSVSIDALGDHPAALRRWLARFGTHANWQAAVPRVEEVDRLLDFVRGRASDPKSADRHTAQIYLFDRQARLAYRTAEMPAARFVADLMAQLSRLP